MTSTGPSEHIQGCGDCSLPIFAKYWSQCPHQNFGNSGSPAQMIFYYILAPSNFLSFRQSWEFSTSNKTSYLINFSLWTFTSRSWIFFWILFLILYKNDFFSMMTILLMYLLFAFFFLNPHDLITYFFVTLNEKNKLMVFYFVHFSFCFVPCLFIFIIIFFQR